MTGRLLRGSGLDVDEWEELRQNVRDVAEGYAATDPANGYLYQSDANNFARQPAPADADAMRERHESADELRRQWQHRFNRTRKP